MLPEGLTSIEYVREMEEQIVQLRIEAGRQDERLIKEQELRDSERVFLERATDLFNENLDAWKAHHNEFIAKITEMAAERVTAATWAAENKALSDRLKTVENWHARVLGAGALLALLLAIVGLATNFLK